MASDPDPSSDDVFHPQQFGVRLTPAHVVDKPAPANNFLRSIIGSMVAKEEEEEEEEGLEEPVEIMKVMPMRRGGMNFIAPEPVAKPEPDLRFEIKPELAVDTLIPPKRPMPVFREEEEDPVNLGNLPIDNDDIVAVPLRKPMPRPMPKLTKSMPESDAADETLDGQEEEFSWIRIGE